MDGTGPGPTWHHLSSAVRASVGVAPPGPGAIAV